MVQVNLIPETLRLAQIRHRYLKIWALLVLASAMLLTIPLTLDWLHHAEALQLRAHNDQLQADLAATRTNVRSLATQAGATLIQLERAKALRSKRAWSAIFAVISQRMTDGCWLTSVATDPASPMPGRVRAQPKGLRGKLQPTVTIDAPRKLRIEGYASQAAQPYLFVSNLKSAGLFSDVSLKRSKREPALKGSYFRFELICEW